MDIWKSRKQAEKADQAQEDTGSALTGIPKHIEPLTRAHAIGHRAARTGFDWDNPMQVMDKVREELDEVRHEIEHGTRERLEEEVGDVLFAVVNLSRYLSIDADRSLHKANEKFIRRFMAMEKAITADDKALDKLSLPEMEAYWQRIKKQ